MALPQKSTSASTSAALQSSLVVQLRRVGADKTTQNKGQLKSFLPTAPPFVPRGLVSARLRLHHGSTQVNSKPVQNR